MKCECCGTEIVISVGQFYRHADGSTSLLCRITCNEVCMVIVSGADLGNRWKDPVRVNNARNISFNEFEDICGTSVKDFTLIRNFTFVV